MLGPEPRQEAELDRLMGDRESARDHRLAGDDRRRRGDEHQGQPGPVGRHQIEGILDRRGRAEQQRALTEIVEHQAGIDQAEPGPADRPAPEMAHVRIKRLRPGHGEEDRAHGEEGELRIVREEPEGPVRAERLQDVGAQQDVRHAEGGERGEINEDDRPENRADPSGPPGLNEEQADQDDDGDRHDQRREARLHDGQPLHRREHRDGRRQHRVPIEERRREHAEHHQPRGPSPLPERARDQCEQGEGAALPLIVGPHRDQHIFEGDDQHQRPEDQADHAENVQPVDRQRVRPDKALFHRVERRGADIAIDDADRAEHQSRQGMSVVAGGRGRRCGG